MGACNGKIPQGDESEQSSDAGGSGRSQSSPKRSIADPSAAEIEDAKNKVSFSPARKQKPFIGDTSSRYVYHDYSMGKSTLGEGMSGPIRLVRSRKTGKEYALKTIYVPENAEDKQRLALEREIKILGTLDHPNVVKLYDVYRTKTTIYLVMEYCSGDELMGHLNKMLDAGQVYGERTCADLVRQMLAATAYLHGKGIAHRDIKPSNFVFESKDLKSNLKMIDFGLSKHFLVIDDQDEMNRRIAEETGSSTASGDVEPRSSGASSFGAAASPTVEDSSKPHNVSGDEPLPRRRTSSSSSAGHATFQRMTTYAGTLAYMAPEVVNRSVAYSMKCDLWSVGVVTFVLLTGEFPFAGQSETQIQKRIGRAKPKFPKHLSSLAKDFIASLLHKDPHKRPSALEAMGHGWLKHAQAGHGGQSVPVSAVHSLKRFISLNRLQRMTLRMFAYHMPAKESTELRKIFDGLDSDRTGRLTFEEIVKGIQRSQAARAAFGGNLQKEVRILFEAFGQDEGGRILYSDFLAACMVQRKHKLSAEEVDSLFDRFDSDGSGLISLDNIRPFFEDDVEATELNAIFDAVDSDHTGSIDKREFAEMVDRIFQSEDAAALSQQTNAGVNEYIVPSLLGVASHTEPATNAQDDGAPSITASVTDESVSKPSSLETASAVATSATAHLENALERLEGASADQAAVAASSLEGLASELGYTLSEEPAETACGNDDDDHEEAGKQMATEVQVLSQVQEIEESGDAKNEAGGATQEPSEVPQETSEATHDPVEAAQLTVESTQAAIEEKQEPVEATQESNETS